MHKVFVVGSINQDVVVSLVRPPSPGETVLGSSLRYFQGGKGANQAVAAARLGADVRFTGRVGEDVFGLGLSEVLSREKLAVELVSDSEAPTGTAVIFVDERGENSIAVVLGANGRLTPDDCDLSGAEAGDLLLLQHEAPSETNFALMDRARGRGMKVFVNAAPAMRYSPHDIRRLDLLIVNEHELGIVFDRKFTCDTAANALHAIMEIHREEAIDLVLTLGSLGVVAAIDAQSYAVPGHHVSAVDTTGAGDCFSGAFAAAVAKGLSNEAALEFANRAAALSVTRRGAGASFPTLAEVSGARLED